MHELCVTALSWGMDWDLFWNGEMSAVLSYYKKWQNECEAKQINMDADAWLLGKYVQLAIASVFQPKDARYPPMPIYMQELEERNKSEEEIRVEQFLKLDSWKRATKEGMQKE